MMASCTFVLLSLLTYKGATAAIFDEEWCQKESRDYDEDVFDYIVAGAGAGGGVVASRLALAGYSTLLLDAGPDYDTIKTQVPLYWPVASDEDQIEWAFRTKNSDDPTRDQVLYPRASMIGGCTMHNAMLSSYTFPDFWDDLKDVTGDSEFSEDKMRQRFKKIENNQYTSGIGAVFGTTGHGYQGYIATSLADLGLLANPRWIDLRVTGVVAAYVLGLLPYNPVARFFFRIFSFPNNLPFLYDILAPGAAKLEGAHLPVQTIDRENGYKRSSVYNFIKNTAAQTDNLTIRPNSFVTRVLISNDSGGVPTAYGVEVKEGTALYEAATGETINGFERTYMARREVIVAGGSFNTPQILMLSGIGPTSELSKFGIPPVVDLPGVGSNLRDKLEATINWEAPKDWTFFTKGCTFGWEDDNPDADPCVKGWEDREYPNLLTTGGTLVSIQKKSDRSLEYPDLYIQLFPNSFRGYEDGWVEEGITKTDVFTMNVNTPRRGGNTGTVRLKSANPFDVVDIDFNGWDQEDIDRTAEIVKEFRKIGDKLIEKGLFTKALWPEPGVDTLDEIKTFVRENGWGHHPLGTAKMGADSDLMAVVNGQFQVRGVNSLRVVDASVFPDQPGFFPTLAIYMLAEKAAEDITKSDISIHREAAGCI